MSILHRVCPVLVLCSLGCPPPPEPAHDSSTGETTDGDTSPADLATQSSGTTGTTSDDLDSSSTSGTTAESIDPPAAPSLTLSFRKVKQFEFEWQSVPGAEYYQVIERDSDDSEWVQLGDDLFQSPLQWVVPLHLRAAASYAVRACNIGGCSESEPVPIAPIINTAIGWFKASNPDSEDLFGRQVALSGDGNTMVVGAEDEASNACEIDGDGADNSQPGAGAAYVFERIGNQWWQRAYLKPFNSGGGDHFARVAISADGTTIAVGAPGESSAIGGVGGDGMNNFLGGSGAVYVFGRDGDDWAEQAYIKPMKPGKQDAFGSDVALSADGNTLVVGAPGEDSDATGVDGFLNGGSAEDSGAAYLFRRVEGHWSQRAYLKASNTGELDGFGSSVAISGDGLTVAVGAPGERSASPGIDGDQLDDSNSSGAVYVFTIEHSLWQQQAYIKSSYPGYLAMFGHSVALSRDGDTLAVGAPGEASAATTIDGDQADDTAASAGAAYVFTRSETWAQQAYIKAPNADVDDMFGYSLALADDGDLLVVGAPKDDGGDFGVTADINVKTATAAGAAHVFTRAGDDWSHTRYLKAPNPDNHDWFSADLALSTDGTSLAITAPGEQSLPNSEGLFQGDDSGLMVGAAYLY